MAPAFKFVDLFAGIGGFHAALSHAGGQCVFVSEIDEQAMATYKHNWVEGHDPQPVLNSDITTAANDVAVDVPEHDVLTAGFPCQPFSKSGFQRGMDEARGTLFWNIAKILEKRRPSVVLLENVRNIAGPRHRHEWDVIIKTLRELGYRVSSSPTVFSPHLLPPHLGGTPQVRDRVFIVGTHVGPVRAMQETEIGPTVLRAPVDGWDPSRWDVEWVLDDDSTIADLDRYRLNAVEREWVQTWDDLVRAHWDSRGHRLPGFPLWSDLWQPGAEPGEDELALMPVWKADFTRKNLAFYAGNRALIDLWRSTHPALASFPATRRKLEWQAQDSRSLWDTVMHFRPSGIRAKAATYLPALVAITQTSIVGSRKRRLTPHEAARLQGLPRSFEFNNRREASSYKQVGNGVAVGAAWHVLRSHVEADARSARPQVSERVRQAMLGADLNPCGDVLNPAAREGQPEPQPAIAL
ncbi:DNA (cytosine-5)-methyltransferase 1 [Microlunatus flavus]|uniref:Cytosine-specific methyltransferase n=2 Tax=Microlunatus flavus TaxID=1036181 RepID=A0A1H9AKZ6_9ACTN|nr:DNA (cytosine-5)-methyltransferase 1 [Microlunatus flavus]